MLFEDETDLLLFPPLEATWGQRGESIPVPLSGFNARRVFFGALSLNTGRRIVEISFRQRAQDFGDFLDRLRWHYRSRHLLMLLDEDPSHTAAASLDLAEDLHIELLWLPKRAPELNAMDQLFRRAKQAVSANRQYPDIDLQAAGFVDWILGLTTREALTKAGVLSDHFWLRTCFPHLR